MPSTSLPESDLARRIARLDRLAYRLDSRFSVAGFRFGWDSILGLIPGIGDLATALPGGFILLEAHRLGASRRTLVRMGANSGLDFVIGGIPILGDAFDAMFKSNRRNIALLKRDLHTKMTQQQESPHGTTQTIP